MAPKLNAYSVFVNDVFHSKRKAGQMVDKPTLFQELGSQWKNMSEEERQIYKDRAKSCPNVKPSFDSFNLDYSPKQITKQESKSNIDQKEDEPKQDQLKEDLKRAVVLKRPREDDIVEDRPKEKKLRPGVPNWKNIRHLNMDTSIKYCDIELFNLHKKCEAIIDSRRDKLTTTPMYTISVNVMCKQLTRDTEEEIFIPIELAIYGYSIEKGKLGLYHVLIDAGDIPSGYINKTKDHATNHKITIPKINPAGYPKEARSDYKKIYKEMLDFTQDGERVVLIGEPRDLNQVRGSIDWLHKQALAMSNVRYPGVNSWTILRITDFVTTMYKCIYLNIRPEPPFAFNYKINHLLVNSSSMDYNDAIMCDYHKKEENATKWCAKSCAIRLISSIESKVLEDMYKLHNLSQIMKTQPKPPSLPPSQSANSQNNQLPEPNCTDELMELGHTAEPLLAITAPPSSD